MIPKLIQLQILVCVHAYPQAGDGAEHAQLAPPEGLLPQPAAREEAVPALLEDPQRQGALATVLVFITSFFTSLVPQQRPDLQVN